MWYCVQYSNDKVEPRHRLWFYKRYPIAQTCGWAMGCLLSVLWRKLTCFVMKNTGIKRCHLTSWCLMFVMGIPIPVKMVLIHVLKWSGGCCCRCGYVLQPQCMHEPSYDPHNKNTLPNVTPITLSVTVGLSVCAQGEIDGLMQERCNSSALAMELSLSCTKPSKWLYIIMSLIGWLHTQNDPYDWLVLRYLGC